MRTYGGQVTPLAQEAVLFGITNTLDAKHTEFVILRSTNSLDQLFLSEFLHRSYPSGRVVIYGADLLLRRGTQGASLRGVMLLSPYPLLSWTPDAIPPVHGASAATGFARGPVGRDLHRRTGIVRATPRRPRSVPINDYAPPLRRRARTISDADHRPATWVTVVGHRQFWPIAVLNEVTEVDKIAILRRLWPRRIVAPEAVHEPDAANSVSAPDSRAPGEMSALLFFCALLGLWHLVLCWNGSTFRPPRLRAFFAPIPHLQHTTLIFLGTVVGLLGVVSGPPSLGRHILAAPVLGSIWRRRHFVSGLWAASETTGCLWSRVSAIPAIRLIRWWRIVSGRLAAIVCGMAWLRHSYLTAHLTSAIRLRLSGGMSISAAESRRCCRKW